MANPDRDNPYSTDESNRTNIYSRDRSSATGWFVGIVVVLALIAIGYLVFAANSGSNNANVNNPAAVTSPNTGSPAPETTTPAPSTNNTPATTAPSAPAESTPAPPASTPAPGGDANAPATTPAQ